MPWWSWRPGSAGGNGSDTDEDSSVRSTVRVGVPAQREPGRVGVPASELPKTELAKSEDPEQISEVTLARIGKALDLLDIRYLADGGGSLLAMWERHAVLFTLEGPDDEILVMRARPHATVPPDWADRAYRVVNEWNHTRRFCKAYVGDPTERGQLPIYAEMQVPLASGAHDALVVEMLDCGAAVATSFVDWLHDEGALL
jgi:Putative bacterial sensory transduction regulator